MTGFARRYGSSQESVTTGKYVKQVRNLRTCLTIHAARNFATFDLRKRLSAMADDWIKWTKGFASKSKVIITATQLGISRAQAAVLWMTIWEWADGETADGWIENITAEHVDMIVEHPGFAHAGASPQIRWLIFDERGLFLPEFKVHNGQSAKQRAENSRRQKHLRGKNA